MTWPMWVVFGMVIANGLFLVSFLLLPVMDIHNWVKDMYLRRGGPSREEREAMREFRETMLALGEVGRTMGDFVKWAKDDGRRGRG